jgi:tetratricopeptide (TPR) repeat protein
MFFLLANLVVLASTAGASWWLSGYDPGVTGHNEKADSLRRSIRCGITLFLVEAAFYCLWQYRQSNDPVSGMAYLVFALPLALVWSGCVSEFLAHGFHRLVDPEDDREFDPKKGLREMDVIGDLIRSGQKDKAIQLCQMLKKTGGVNPFVLEMTLEHLGVPQQRVRKPKPLLEADRLRSQGRFQEAELILNSLLAQNPRNLDAAMMLMRLYAQDQHCPEKAGEVLRELEKQPHLPSAHLEFARRSIGEWAQGKPRTEEIAVQPESIDELLAQGYFGTAIEILEQKIKEQPQDFDTRLTLAEIYARHCSDDLRAKKIVQQIEASPAFSPEQKLSAWPRLEEWRKARTQRK